MTMTKNHKDGKGNNKSNEKTARTPKKVSARTVMVQRKNMTTKINKEGRAIGMQDICGFLVS